MSAASGGAWGRSQLLPCGDGCSMLVTAPKASSLPGQGEAPQAAPIPDRRLQPVRSVAARRGIVARWNSGADGTVRMR